MESNHRSESVDHRGIIDFAILYLCRQGSQWVIVIESPRISCAVPFRDISGNSYDARAELLSSAHRACPDATIISSDGVLESATYDWRIEVRSVEPHRGDLGMALHGEFSRGSSNMRETSLYWIGGRCHLGMSPAVSGRPRNF